MSWSTFKNILQPQMQNLVYGNSSDNFAKAFTNAYDIAIKSGTSLLTNINLSSGNTQAMENLLKLTLTRIAKTKNTTLLDEIGPCVQAYWAGATLQLIPPAIPAPGAVSNIAVTQAPVINSGTWTKIPVQPNNNPSIFLDAFINSAKLHLLTVSGFHFMISSYPTPAPPAPSVLPWQGYSVS